METPALWETALEDEAILADAAERGLYGFTPDGREYIYSAAHNSLIFTERTESTMPRHNTPTCKQQRPKIGLARAQELAAQFKIAQWADGQVSRNRARDRYYASDANYGGDWPEDH